MKRPKTILHRLLFLALATMGCLLTADAQGSKRPREPFDVYIEFVERICDYHKLFPSVDFVYGDPNKDTSGFLVVVTPHPENAAATLVPYKLVSSTNFRVWIEAGQQEPNGWKRFGLFYKNNQCLQYLDVNRRNTNAFALYISSDEMKERIPHGDLHNITPILNFDLRIVFARNLTSKWPTEWAYPTAHTATVNQWRLHFYPSENFLTNKIEWAEEGDVYMKNNPKRKYFFNRELLWQMPGWFFHLGYKQKNYIREKINDNHYVILKLWKDKEHTRPLTFDYFKEQLWPGGFSDDPNMMVKDRNYIAFPHKGFDDWSLFLPWTIIHYWWKDGIKATKENHTCYGYYTLTLSNDGETPATNHDFDNSGWLSIDVGYEEPAKPAKKNLCKHPWFKYSTDNRGIASEVKANGCIEDYNVYWVWKICGVCGEYLDKAQLMETVGTRDIAHDMKETGRTVKEKVTTIGGVNGNQKEVKTIYDVVYACQNECCDYKTVIPSYETQTIISDPPFPPKDTVIVDNPDEPQPPKKDDDDKNKKKKCPPHDWVFSSKNNKFVDRYKTTVVEETKMDTDTLCLHLGTATIELVRRDGVFLMDSLVSRQTWLALNKDNNYLGISKQDQGVMNNLNYQEAYDFISKVAERANSQEGISMTFSLPSPEEMLKLLKDSIVRIDTLRGRRVTSFYVDSIEVYDGKGRKLTKEQLATAPEGAKVRIMIGKMDKDGNVTMADIKDIDNTTGFVLKGEPNAPGRKKKIVTVTRFYHTYKRTCTKCGLTQDINENVFRNGRYHRPLINE